MDKLTPEQDIKAQLVVLAEYLQTTLSDAQVRLYAPELADLGPEGLRKAIACLKADPTLWPGKFPLPAKIRSYLVGDVNILVADSVERILGCSSPSEIFRLPRLEYEVALAYGIKAITDRSADQTGTLYAQLRDTLKARYLRATIEGRLGLTRDRGQIGTTGGLRLADQGEDGAGGKLEAGQGSPGGVQRGSEGPASSS